MLICTKSTESRMDCRYDHITLAQAVPGKGPGKSEECLGGSTKCNIGGDKGENGI